MKHFRVCEMQIQFGFSEWMEQRLLARCAGSAPWARILGALDLSSLPWEWGWVLKAGLHRATLRCPSWTPVFPDRGGEAGASLPVSYFGQQDTLSAGDASRCLLSRKQELPRVLGLKDVGVTLSLHSACQTPDCSSEQRCRSLTVGSRSH